MFFTKFNPEVKAFGLPDTRVGSGNEFLIHVGKLVWFSDTQIFRRLPQTSLSFNRQKRSDGMKGISNLYIFCPFRMACS